MNKIVPQDSKPGGKAFYKQKYRSCFINYGISIGLGDRIGLIFDYTCSGELGSGGITLE